MHRPELRRRSDLRRRVPRADLLALALLLGWSLAGAPRLRAQDADAGVPAEAAEDGVLAPTTEETADAEAEELARAAREEADRAREAAELAALEATRAEEEAREAALEQLREAHIGELAGRTRAALQTARPLLRATGEITRIERALPATEREIQRLAHPTQLARIPHLSQRELADLRQDWRYYAHRLEEWQAAISERAGEVEATRTSLVELKRAWSDLRTLSEAAGRPQPRHDRIAAGLTESRRGLSDVESARDDLAALSDRVSDVQIIVEDVSDQLRDAANAYRERLAVQDAPPLWRGLASEESEGSVTAQARETLAERTETPEELLAEMIPAGVGLVLGFVFLYVLVLQLARVQREAAHQTSGALAREVLTRPVASSALLALFLGAFLLEHAPIIAYDALFFATLVPLARALPPLCPSALRRPVLGTLAFVAIDRVQSMLADGSAILRLMLLLEALGVLVALGLWLRRGAAEAPSWSRALAALTVLLFAVGLVANVVGYLFLATVLTRGVGFSAYTGVSLAGAVLVAEAILDLLVVSPAGQRLRSLREHAASVRERTLKLFASIAVIAWCVATLDGFGVWGPFSAWAEETLVARHEIGSLEISLGAVLGCILILVATSAILRVVRFVLELDVLPRFDLEPGVDGAISGLTRYLLAGTGLLFALAFLGIDASQIALVAGALGVGIGFGLQGIVANFIAGIVLMLERPVRLGDFIEVGSLVGSVDRIGLRSSTVKGLDGAEVIVPNESLISREVVNWTLSDRKRRVEVKVGVAYGTDPHRVIEILKSVAREHRDPLVGIDPEVRFNGFGESSLDFTLQFWAKSFGDSIVLESEVGLGVHDALVAAGIEIPFPQRDVHLIPPKGEQGKS